MIKTVQEIAALCLPGFPKTERRVRELIKRENWEAAGQKGKAPLYRIPAHIQAHIIDRNGLMLDIEEPVGESKHLTARLLIVRAFRAYCRDNGLKLGQGEAGFIALYTGQSRSNAAEPFPRWVFDVYPDFSVASLRNWRAKFTQDPSSLKDRYGNRKGQSILARANGGEVAKHIAAILCSASHAMGAWNIRKAIGQTFGDQLEVDGRMVDLPLVRSFERHIAEWKRNNPELYERATNPDGWRNKYMLALGNASGGITRLNQRWEIDASPMDVLCTDGRYVVYALVDVWSRRLMLHLSRTATTEGSLQLIRRACMEWGMPESIKTDNGSDFISKRFKNALLHLGVEQVVSGPYQPWKKAYVERVIRTFQHGFAPTMPGFIGHSVADRKKIEGVKSFASNLGADQTTRYNIELSHTELQSHINSWIEGDYHQRPHRGLKGMTPFAKAASSTDTIRMIEDVRALDVLLAPVAGTRTVSKKSIQVEGATFYNDLLQFYMGKDVFVRLNPDDMGLIYVFDLDHNFICEAVNWDRQGVDRTEAIAQAKATQKQALNEVMTDARKVIKQEYSPGKIAEKMNAHHARAAGKVKAFPKQSETYTTPSIAEATRATRKDFIAPERTAEEKAKHEAFKKEFVEFQQRQQPARLPQDIWWENAKALEARLAAGEKLTEDEVETLENAKTSPWYLARTAAEARKTNALNQA